MFLIPRNLFTANYISTHLLTHFCDKKRREYNVFISVTYAGSLAAFKGKSELGIWTFIKVCGSDDLINGLSVYSRVFY